MLLLSDRTLYAQRKLVIRQYDIKSTILYEYNAVYLHADYSSPIFTYPSFAPQWPILPRK